MAEAASLTQTIQTMESGLAAAGFLSDPETNRPYAYLNYLIFDKNRVFVNGGWQRIPENAGFDPGQEAPYPPGSTEHERVAFDQPIIIPANATDGYIYVWVSNESENTKVWFDDLKVTHTQTIVTQATDYGVWGDVLRELKAAEFTYRHGYQGQFAENDEETGWNHFELREYDAVMGRWISLDPFGEFWSPYIGMGNDPINNVDPNGGFICPKCPKSAEYDIYRQSNLNYHYSELAGGDGVFQLLPDFTKTLASDFGGYNFDYYNSFSSQLNDKNFYAMLYKSAPSRDAQAALAKASIVNKDATILYATLALPVVIISAGELIPVAEAVYLFSSTKFTNASILVVTKSDMYLTIGYRHLSHLGFRGLLRISAPGTPLIKGAVELNWQSIKGVVDSIPIVKFVVDQLVNPNGFYNPKTPYYK